ncbi:MAG: cytoskeletal protein RodZ [Dinoroseobacter sp.]|jgi:cytoskeletal protein RodZ
MTAETDDLVDPNADPLLGFDDFQVSLGDTFRGERATQGVSLLDVQRDLRIKAEYLAAIEDANPDGFDGKGFIAGYVRSYARYLHLDPDWAFRKFCSESGFQGVHGFTSMSERAPKAPLPTRGKMHNDASLGRAMPRVQPHRAWYNDLDPGALSSAAVLIALIVGLGYGAWSVVNELQRVTVVPVETTPQLLAEVDPLVPATHGLHSGSGATLANMAPSVDALDRLFRPQALDMPVMVPRDGPIAAIDPDANTALSPVAPSLGAPSLGIGQIAADAPVTPQVVAEGAPELVLLAVAPAWVRVRAADGTVLLEKVLSPGERFVLPATEEPPTLRAGAAGSVYFELAGQVYGPAGAAGSVASNIVLRKSASANSGLSNSVRRYSRRRGIAGHCRTCLTQLNKPQRNLFAESRLTCR